MATTSSTNTGAVLALLVFPGFDAQSDEQARGTACVWCGTRIGTSTAVDLGERKVELLGTEISVFPRGCRPCTAKASHGALLVHAPDCAQCIHSADECETGRALYRLARENRR